MSGSDMWTEKDKQTRFFFSFSVKKMRNLEKVLDDFVKKRYIDYHFLYPALIFLNCNLRSKSNTFKSGHYRKRFICFHCRKIINFNRFFRANSSTNVVNKTPCTAA